MAQSEVWQSETCEIAIIRCNSVGCLTADATSQVLIPTEMSVITDCSTILPRLLSTPSTNLLCALDCFSLPFIETSLTEFWSDSVHTCAY